VYQTARDFGLGLLVLIGKDVLKRFFDVDNFVHIRAAVTVRILGINTETKRKKAHTLQNISTLGLVDNVLTLREKNSVAISVFGEAKGDALLYWMGHPVFRLVNRALLNIPLFIVICLVLPGVLETNISFVILLTIIPLVRSALMKDLALVSRVVCKVDFVFETLSAITVLVLFGVMLEDARVVICPILFWMWLDSRLSDAICVFYHSNHRGSQYRKSRVLTLVTGLFTVVLVFFPLGFARRSYCAGNTQHGSFTRI